MAAKQKKKHLKRARLGFIGVWATAWWGVSCAYVLLLFWAARNDYVALAGPGGSAVSVAKWQSALAGAYDDSVWLPALLAAIVSVWVVGGWLWLRELKRQKVSYGDGFRDLFLTLRR